MEDIPQDSAMGRKRVRSEEEAHYYYKKIKKMMKKKMKFLVEQESKKSKLESPTENEKKTKMKSKPVMVISNPQDHHHHHHHHHHHVLLPNKKVVVVKASHETKKLKRPITTTTTTQQKKKKKRKPIIRTRMPLVSNHVTEQLKQFIVNEMNGEEVKVVIQKKLYESDLKEDQNRLNIPINQLQTHDFLTEQEKRDLKNRKGMQVKLLGPRLRMHEKPMVLKMWHLKSSDNYVLIRNWNEFVKENEEDLKENTMIQVWSFRRYNQLCFAITCLDTNVDHQNDVTAASPIV